MFTNVVYLTKMTDSQQNQNIQNESNNFGYLKDHESQASSTSESIDANNNNFTSDNNNLLPSKLSFKTKFFYSLGHIYNDLTVSIWFSYTLLFFQYRFSGPLAGSLLLLGQVADAIASPFVGYESDKSSFWFCRVLGKRKAFHLLGK